VGRQGKPWIILKTDKRKVIHEPERRKLTAKSIGWLRRTAGLIEAAVKNGRRLRTYLPPALYPAAELRRH
jgi:hypothetical protein